MKVRGRVFGFKKTKIITTKRPPLQICKPSHAENNTKNWKAVKEWLQKDTSLNPEITAARYAGTFLKLIAGSTPARSQLWATVQEEIRGRIIDIRRDGLMQRYKYVFSRNYLRHSYLNEALYVAFFYKDLRFLKELLIRLFKDVNFFKHRFLMYYLRAAFADFSSANANLGGSKGMFIKFRGKLSQAGNSRRRRFLVGCGQVSTSQSSRYEVEKFQIKTFTGAIGCTVVLCSE